MNKEFTTVAHQQKQFLQLLCKERLTPLMPFNGGLVSGVAGGIAVSHNQTISKLVTINNCPLTPTTANLPDIANDGTTVIETKYTNTTANNEVIGYQGK